MNYAPINHRVRTRHAYIQPVSNQLVLAIILATLFGLISMSGWAATGTSTWTASDTTGNWSSTSTTTDWKSATFPNSAGWIAQSATASGNSGTVNLDINATIGMVKNGGNSGGNNFTVNGTANTLTFDGTGLGNNGFGDANIACIFMGSSINAVTVQPNILMLNTDLELGPSFSTSATSSVLIGSLGATTLNNSGNTGNSTTAHNLNIKGICKAGSTGVTINSSIGSSGAGIAIVNTFSTGNVLLAGALGSSVTSLTHNGTATLTVSGNYTGTGSITVQQGTLVLSGTANSYSGATTITAGTLSIGSTATLGDGTGTLILGGGTLTTTASRAASTAPIANPINLTADSVVQTTSTAATVDLNFNNNSISGTAGTLMFTNNAASGTGLFEPRFTGNGFNFARPIIIANGNFGTTRLDSYNASGTQIFSGAISGNGSYLRTVSSGTGGTTIFTGNNTYSGNTTINAGTLEVDNTAGSGTGSGNVAVNSGGTLSGSGSESGNVAVNSGGHTRPGSVTNNIGGNLSYATGSKADFDLTSSASGNGNGQIILSGTSSVLGGSNVTININCGSTLDQVNDYVLFKLIGASANISSNFNATPAWLGTTPANSGSFRIVNDNINKKVLLHYVSANPPVVASSSATPSTLARNQSTFISVTVTPGSGTIDPNIGVTINTTPIGGSSSIPLLLSDTPNVYTNTLVVSASTTAGSTNLLVTATDSTPLAGTANISLTIVSGNETWNGNGTADNWSTNANWTSGLAPGLVGDAIIFDGTTRLTPAMDNSYTIPALTFASTAGSFSISAVGGSILTLTGGVTNNSANAQALTVPIAMNGGQTFNAAAGDLTLNGIISGTGFGLTKVGSSTLTLGAANIFDGVTTVANGTLKLANALALQNSSLNYNSGTVTFDSAITTATVGGLSGSQNLTLLNTAGTPAAVALTIGGNGTGTTYSGQLSGTGASITKSGTNTLTLSGNNNYSGGTTVNGGSLILTGINTISGGTTVNSGGTLSLSSGSFSPVTAGALNLGTGSSTAGTMTIGVDASFSSTTIGGNNNGGVLTINGGNVSLGAFTGVRDASSSSATTTSGLVISGGTVTATTVNLSSGNSGGDLTVNNPGSLSIGNSGTTGGFLVGNGTSTIRGGFLTVAGGTLTYSGVDGLIINNKSTSQGTAAFTGGVSTLTGITLQNPANTAGNAVLNISGGTIYLGGIGLVVNTPGTATASANLSGGTLGATVNWSSSAALPISNTVIFQAADGASVGHNIALNGILSGSGTLKKTGVGTLTLGASAGNSYSGGTLISAGTLLVTNTTGSGTGTGNVTNSGTLGGNGIISGGVTNLAGATVQPGLGGTDTSTLTINNNLTMISGTMQMALNRGNAQTASKITLTGGSSVLTKGGTLTVVNAGASVQAGDSFTLFNAVNQSGIFSTTNLPALGAGTNWWTADNFATLLVNKLSVTNATYTREKGTSLKIAISDLVTSFPAGGNPSLVVTTSANGATLSTNSTYIFYTPANDNNDSFSYTVNDTRGGTSTGTITVNVVSQPGGSSGSISVSGGVATVGMFGIPGVAYDVQRSLDLNSWTTLTSSPPLGAAPPFTAAPDGQVNFTDNFSDLGSTPGAAYYRLIQH